jgi:glutamate racemase
LIGIFDSGIGGLSVLRALQAELPHERFVYVADSGHAPYGERDTAHVLARSHAIAAHLIAVGAKALVMACNTATAAAVQHLRSAYPALPVIGIEPAIKPAVALSRTGHIGVMATRGTLASAKFQALLAAHAAGARFSVRACDGLAELIERYAVTANATDLIAACADNASALGRFGSEPDQIDVLVLGCTHYPLARDMLRDQVGPGVTLIDPGDAVARQTRRVLEAANLLAPAQPSQAGSEPLMFATGQTQALDAAALRWMGPRTTSSMLLI